MCVCVIVCVYVCVCVCARVRESVVQCWGGGACACVSRVTVVKYFVMGSQWISRGSTVDLSLSLSLSLSGEWGWGQTESQ